MYYKYIAFFLITFIVSCQPVEIIKPVEFDNSKLIKIFINAKEKNINIKYNPIFAKENIEDQLKVNPLTLIQSWVNENIVLFGNQNKFVINIIEASIFKKEIENVNAKKYQEKTVFYYEVFFLVEYAIYDDKDYLLANTTVETTRSTTSQKYISLNETELIISDLLNKSIKDFVKETKLMTDLYLSSYIK